MSWMSEEKENRFGKCPWCERHNVKLTFVLGTRGGRLMCEWICNECYKKAREVIRNETELSAVKVQ